MSRATPFPAFDLAPAAIPAPPTALVLAAAEPAGRAVLADWLEERGDPRADDVRSRTWLPVERILAVAPPAPALPLEAVPAIFAGDPKAPASGATGMTARQRLDAFLRVEGDGRKGIVQVRERQARLRERLAKLGRPVAPPAEPAGADRRAWGGADRKAQRARRVDRAAIGGQSRDSRRATASGDAVAAVALGESYHCRVKSLYTSARAEVVYGRGGQEAEADVYAKSYTVTTGRGTTFHPVARWRNAGARVEYAAHPRHRGAGEVVIETARGTEVARFPLPTGDLYFGAGLVDGDLFGRRRRIAGLVVVERFGPRKVRGQRRHEAVRTGWAVGRTERRGDKSVVVYEHGESIAAIRAELARKAEAARLAEVRRALSARLERAARLIARLCPSLPVTHEDRRAAGYCDAGTQGFLERYGLAGRETVTIADLRATGRPEVERPIMLAARRAAEARFAAPATV